MSGRLAQYLNGLIDTLLTPSEESRLLSDAGDFGLAAAFAVAFPLLRLLFDFLIFKPAGRYVLGIQNVDNKRPSRAKEAALYKWKESGWKAVVYLTFVVFAFLVSHRERWFYDSRYFWLGCTKLPCDLPVSLGVRILYCMEMGFYAQAIPSLMFWEVRRKDYWETMGHHLATLTLIAYSYYLNFTRAGTLTFLCHDINDIFMESAKMARYAGKEKITNILFVLFMLSWFASRLWYYPTFIVRSTLFEPIPLISRVFNVYPHPHYEIFNGLLLFLLGLHIYWSYLIVKIVIRTFTHGEVDDVREDEDDGDKAE